MATTINTEKQDATVCILCQADTSLTQGYCVACEKRMKQQAKVKK